MCTIFVSIYVTNWGQYPSNWINIHGNSLATNFTVNEIMKILPDGAGMKYYKIFLSTIFMFFLIKGNFIFPTEFTIGVSSGVGTLSNPELRSEYGRSFVYNPYIGAEIFEGLSINIGYEGGFKKESRIYHNSTLELSGLQLFVEYTFNKGDTFAFVKGGIGLYNVKRIFSAEEYKEYDFIEKNPGFIFGFGMKFPILKNILIKVEVNDLIVKMKPFYGWVDGGGVRYLAGFVIKFDI